MTIKEKLLLESKAWALEKRYQNKHYFERLEHMHEPDILWIGSSDSLISVREITNTEPGEILLHQNIGNQVRQDDLSFMAILQKAVEVDHVSHIIVCGYSHCSGITNVVRGNTPSPLMMEWLTSIRLLYEKHADELANLDPHQKAGKLAELNVAEQVTRLSQMDIIQRAWERGNKPTLYGLYFDLTHGSMKEILTIKRQDAFKAISNVA